MNDLRSLEGLSQLLIEQNNNVVENNDSPINQLPALTLSQRSKTTSSQTSASSSKINTQTKIPMLLNYDSLKKVSLKRTISTTNKKNTSCDISNCINNNNDGKDIKVDNDTFDQNNSNINESGNKYKEGFSYINSMIGEIDKLSIGFNEYCNSKHINSQDYCDEAREGNNIHYVNDENKNMDESRDGSVENLSCQQATYLMQCECKNDISDNIDDDEINELEKDVNENNNDENGLSLALDNIDNDNVNALRLMIDNESMNNTPEIIDTGDLRFNSFFQNNVNDEKNKQNRNDNNDNCNNCEDQNKDDGLEFVLDENNDSDDNEVDLDYSDNGTDKYNDSLDIIDFKNECDQNDNDTKSRHNEIKPQSHPVLSLMDMYSNNTKNVLMSIPHFPNEEFTFFPTVSKSSSNIGTGTSGIVTKAFHLKSCNVVAIKVCRSLSGHDFINFQREAALYQKFAHVPEITSCLGFGRDNENHLCMALEYMNMGSLCNLKSCSVTEKHSKYIAKSILIALQALHSEHYVHNDIKPSNVLINKRGDVKLSDFGCVKQMINKDTPLSHVVGSKHYFSPEKWLHSPPIQYTTKSDIWSLGIMLYELLTSISNENRNSNKENNNDDGYTISPTLSPEIFSSTACDFIAQCLIQDSNKRPSCEELLKHEWLLDSHKIAFETIDSNNDNSNAENENDLLFMIQSLITYYSQKNFLQNADIINNGSNNSTGITFNNLNNNGSNNADYIINNIGCCENNDKKQYSTIATLSPTRILSDNTNNNYTDNERIENIAKHTRYTVEQVTNIIKYYVGDIRSKLMMKN